MNRGPLYNSTSRHDDRANENTGPSAPAIADDGDERCGKNTAKGQNGRHDTKETPSRFVEIWSGMSISLGHHFNRNKINEKRKLTNVPTGHRLQTIHHGTIKAKGYCRN